MRINNLFCKVLIHLVLAIALNVPLTVAEPEGYRIAKPNKFATVRAIFTGEEFGFIADMLPSPIFIDTPRRMTDIRHIRHSKDNSVNSEDLNGDYGSELKVTRPDCRDGIDFNPIGDNPNVSVATLIGDGGTTGTAIKDSTPNSNTLDFEKFRLFEQDQIESRSLSDCKKNEIKKMDLGPYHHQPPKNCWKGWIEKKVCRDRLAEGLQGPPMIILTGGTFTMGSDSEQADADEITWLH